MANSKIRRELVANRFRILEVDMWEIIEHVICLKVLTKIYWISKGRILLCVSSWSSRCLDSFRAFTTITRHHPMKAIGYCIRDPVASIKHAILVISSKYQAWKRSTVRYILGVPKHIQLSSIYKTKGKLTHWIHLN